MERQSLRWVNAAEVFCDDEHQVRSHRNAIPPAAVPRAVLSVCHLSRIPGTSGNSTDGDGDDNDDGGDDENPDDVAAVMSTSTSTDATRRKKTTMQMMLRRNIAINLRLTDTWFREYQVLEGRTHPQMTMDEAVPAHGHE